MNSASAGSQRFQSRCTDEGIIGQLIRLARLEDRHAHPRYAVAVCARCRLANGCEATRMLPIPTFPASHARPGRLPPQRVGVTHRPLRVTTTERIGRRALTRLRIPRARSSSDRDEDAFMHASASRAASRARELLFAAQWTGTRAAREHSLATRRRDRPREGAKRFGGDLVVARTVGMHADAQWLPSQKIFSNPC